MRSVTVVSAVNDERTLRSCLLSSPELLSRANFLRQDLYLSAALAYNAALSKVGSEIVVFVHQDVYLPSGWFVAFDDALDWLGANDPDWGVLGVYGVDTDGKSLGWTYSNGLQRVLGGEFVKPILVQTLDEVILVIRRASGLRFDPALVGFHMYGTDLCREATRRGMNNYVIPAFAIHNSNGIRTLPLEFWKCYLYLRRKWWDALPIVSPCAVLTRSLRPMLSTILQRYVRFAIRRSPVGTRRTDPAALYQELVDEGAVTSGAKEKPPTVSR